MNYLSVCSGIEAATVAWHDLGWKPLGFSEIEKFPSEVLAHHYPNTPNLGDMTKYKEWDFGSNRLDLLVGGTPCQSFSVAGLRKGLDDPRGNLALTYVGILDKFRPKWCLWENVPGVLSSNKGRDFGSFLGALAELGYGWSYRVLDAQYFGVPQRRRRVFVVGCLGNWESAAKVLFESESLRWDIKKGRTKGQEATNQPIQCFDRQRSDEYNTNNIASTLSARDYKSATDLVVIDRAAFNQGINAQYKPYIETTETMPTLVAKGPHAVAYNITFCDANGRRKDRPNGGLYVNETNVANTITQSGVGTNIVQSNKPIGFDAYNSAITGDVSKTLDTGSDYHHVPNVYSETMAIRRLTTIECERLQGFPDNYTNIKENCPDGPRYKALGNSMAVPVMKWIGERIANV